MVAPTKNKKFDPNLPCPCGSGLTYGACCCDYLEHGKNVTEGPLTVLRTRFVAYKLGFYDYVLRSWHPDYRPKIKPQIIAKEGKGIVYTKLEAGLPQVQGEQGFIEYNALFRAQNGFGKLHEKARFLMHDGVWFYADGIVD